MTYHLTVRREGSLLSKVLDREITDAQLEAIRTIVDNLEHAAHPDAIVDTRSPAVPEGQPLAVTQRFLDEGDDAPAGAGEEVEAHRG